MQKLLSKVNEIFLKVQLSNHNFQLSMRNVQDLLKLQLSVVRDMVSLFIAS